MKPTFLLFAFISITAILLSCGKDKNTEDPHNHSLLTKSPDQIRAEVKGKWQVQRYHYSVCGIAGCNVSDYTYPTNEGDFIFFNANDTIIKVKYDYSQYFIYEKAVVNNVKNNDPSIATDSIFRYELQNGFAYWVMDSIKNDTLVINGGMVIYYCLRK